MLLGGGIDRIVPEFWRWQGGKHLLKLWGNLVFVFNYKLILLYYTCNQKYATPPKSLTFRPLIGWKSAQALLFLPVLSSPSWSLSGAEVMAWAIAQEYCHLLNSLAFSQLAEEAIELTKKTTKQPTPSGLRLI